jgi:hypothetical protein
MPISSSDFEKAERAPSAVLMDFLRDNYRDAFCLDELVDTLGKQGCNMTSEEVEVLLDSLEYGGKVRSRVVDSITYYKYSEVVGFKLI